MARARAKKSKPQDSSSQIALDGRPNRRLEALGLLMLGGALALCFAIFSFDPQDASGTGNLVGPLGVELARLVLGGVGVIGYLAALACVAFAGATLLGRLRIPSLLSLISGLSITLGVCVLAHLLVDGSDLLGHPAGGALGAVLGMLLREFAGPAGAALFGALFFLLGVLGISNLSFSEALKDAGRLLRFLGKSVTGRATIWVEAKSAAKKREVEIMESARSQRAQAKLDQKAREEALRDKLEEKARVAVLKATAKAEEKALKKLAAQEAKSRVENAVVDTEETERMEVPSVKPLEAPDEFEESEEPEDVAEAVEVAEPSEPPQIVVHPSVAEEVEEPDVSEEETPVEIVAKVQTRPAADVIEEVDTAQIELAEEVQREAPSTGLSMELPAQAELRPIPSGGAQPSGLGPVIIERQAVEVEFDEDAIAVEPEQEPVKLEYELPPLNLLDYEGEAPVPVDGELLRTKANRLEEKLKTYNVQGKVTAIRPGPIVTTYEYQPAPGIKVSKIANLADDIAMSMEAMRVRIVAPIPGKGVVGIELPNERRENVYLKEMIAHDRFKKSKSLLTLALGKDVEGNAEVRDLRKMPHFLIAGTTGSGKSVSINTMILSILYKATPEQVKFIMVDPKMLELSLYNDIPHLLLPVVTDARKASIALQWAVDEMERRYQLLSDMKVRDIDGFNEKREKLIEMRSRGETEVLEGKKRIKDPWPDKEMPDSMPYIVVLIDEFADLMCVAPRDVEGSVQRLAQKARAAGIHVLLATQRPSTDVITGVIKNNFPSRISFRVASRHDSATILNNPGAENLLGMGDSLMLGATSPVPHRIHGGFVSEQEVERVVDFWKAQAKPQYDENILKRREEDEDGAGSRAEDVDEMYDQAVRIVTETRKASISSLQRRLRVGYNRAARMIEMMESQGIVGAPSGPKNEREILVQAMDPDGPPRN